MESRTRPRDSGTTIWVDRETKDAIDELAEESSRSTIDEIRWLIRMEKIRLTQRRYAEEEMHKQLTAINDGA